MLASRYVDYGPAADAYNHDYRRPKQNNTRTDENYPQLWNSPDMPTPKTRHEKSPEILGIKKPNYYGHAISPSLVSPCDKPKHELFKSFDETPIFHRYQQKLSKSLSKQTQSMMVDQHFATPTEATQTVQQVTPSPHKSIDRIHSAQTQRTANIGRSPEKDPDGTSVHGIHVLEEAERVLVDAESTKHGHPLNGNDPEGDRIEHRSAYSGVDCSPCNSRSNDDENSFLPRRKLIASKNRINEMHQRMRDRRQSLPKVASQGMNGTQPDSLLKLALLTKPSKIQAPILTRTLNRRKSFDSRLERREHTESERRRSRSIPRRRSLVDHKSAEKANPNVSCVEEGTESPEQAFRKRLELALNDYTPSPPNKKERSREKSLQFSFSSPRKDTPHIQSERKRRLRPSMELDATNIELESPVPVVISRQSRPRRESSSEMKTSPIETIHIPRNMFGIDDDLTMSSVVKESSPVATIHVKNDADEIDEDITMSVVPLHFLAPEQDQPLSSKNDRLRINIPLDRSSRPDVVRNSVELVETSFSTMSTSVFDAKERKRRDRSKHYASFFERILPANAGALGSSQDRSRPESRSSRRVKDEVTGSPMSALTDGLQYEKKAQTSNMASAVGKLLQLRFRSGKASHESYQREDRRTSVPISSLGSNSYAMRSSRPLLNDSRRKYRVDTEVPRRSCLDLFTDRNCFLSDSHHDHHFELQTRSYVSSGSRDSVSRGDPAHFRSYSRRENSIPPDSPYDLPTHFPKNHHSPLYR